MVHESSVHHSLETWYVPCDPHGGIECTNLPTQPSTIGTVKVKLGTHDIGRDEVFSD